MKSSPVAAARSTNQSDAATGVELDRDGAGDDEPRHAAAQHARSATDSSARQEVMSSDCTGRRVGDGTRNPSRLFRQKQMRHVLLVLGTLGVEHLRIRHKGQFDVDRPRTGVSLGIVDGDFNLQVAAVRPAEPLCDFRGIGQGTACRIQSLIVTETDAGDFEGLAARG